MLWLWLDLLNAGAALLSTSAALHSGAGIVHLLHPFGMEMQLASSIPELIKIPYQNDVEKILTLMNKASAVYVGPGLGREQKTFDLLKQILPALTVPCVIDADALYFLANNDVVLPKQCVLTPHRGEMDRLLKTNDSHAPVTETYLNRCVQYAQDKKVTLVLKGGPTYILTAEGMIYICPRGDPGMATAGSGDVLTGLIAGLLAQKLPPKAAALLGCYIHGVAGEFAASDVTSYCMTASDILYRFPEGFFLEEM